MVTGQILDKLTEMWTEMAMDGVQDVIYVQYSNPEGENVTFEKADGDGVPKRCQEAPAPLRCHRLDLPNYLRDGQPADFKFLTSDATEAAAISGQCHVNDADDIRELCELCSCRVTGERGRIASPESSDRLRRS